MRHILPVLPLKNTVVYPQIIVPLRVGRAKSLAAVHAAVEHGRQLLAVAQLDGEMEDPQREDLRNIGTIVKISRIEKSDNSAQVIVQGVQRVRLTDATPETSYMAFEYEKLPVLTLDESSDDAPAIDALLRENLELAQRIAELLDSDNGAQAYHALVGSISPSS